MLQKSKLTDHHPIIYLITGGEATAETFELKSPEIIRLIASAVEAGVSLIQIREKKLPAKLLFELAHQAADITKNSNTKLLINERADVARLSGADGVHLPSDSIPVEAIRKTFGEEFIIGSSVHSFSEAKDVENSGVNFVTFGPVFHTPSKERFGEPQGLEKLAEVSENLAIPVLGIGGINDSNYASVSESGAAGFAAIRFLSDPKKLLEIVYGVKK